MRGTGTLLLLCGITPLLEGSAFFGPEPPAARGECASCHPAEWNEWKGSRHAAAWIDPVFQSEFAHGRAAWCVGCHAPLVPDATAPDPALADQGVACAGCHTRGGHMVSTRRAVSSPHDTVADPAFGSPGFCAGCHEFNFPVLGARGRLDHYTDEPMQATVSQHRSSGIAAECTDCHVDHSFRGSHDAELVASALDIATCRTGGAIEVAVTNRGAGHNIPSGGVHRRMVLRAWTSRAPERMQEAGFGRRFRPLRGGGKQTVSDTTIPPGRATHHRFRLAALGDEKLINLELRYIYSLDERQSAQPIWRQRLDPRSLARCSARARK